MRTSTELDGAPSVAERREDQPPDCFCIATAPRGK